jgi:hypothetical protein
MTRKHFQKIASILNRIFKELNLNETERWTIYEYFEAMLREENSNFDSARFYEAVNEGRK